MTAVEAIKDAAAADPIGAYSRAGYGGELRPAGNLLLGHCILHSGDNDPSFAVTRSGQYAGRFKCFGCSLSGDIIGFYSKLHGTDFRQSVKALSELLSIGDVDKPAYRKPKIYTPTPVEIPPDPEPLDESIALACHQTLLADSRSLNWLTTKKGLPLWIVAEMQIGLCKRKWNPKLRAETRFTIPVQFSDGRPGHRDIRGYKPHAEGGCPKMLPWEEGRGAPCLYAWPAVCNEPVIVWCEGEIDCCNLLARGLAAVSSTCGVQGCLGPKLVLPDLTGKTFYVIGDNDDAGRRLNEQLPAKLYAAGAADVKIVPWPDGLPKGYDVSDAVVAGTDFLGIFS